MNATDAAFDEAPGGSSPIVVVPPRGYKALCIANLLASSIASVLCIILIVAMVVPLVYRKRRKHYSTYNLYVAFMAVPDLIEHIFVVYTVLTHEQWNPHPYTKSESSTSVMWLFDHKWNHSIATMAMTGNLYVNAFLTHELYKLLRNSNQRKKHPPPTMARVTTHAMISYGLGLFIFFLPTLVIAFSDGKATGMVDGIPYYSFLLIYVAVIPLSVVGWFSYQIVRHRLLRSTESMYEGRLRILVVYFARIVLSDLLLWIPACALYYAAYAAASADFSTNILMYNSSLLFMAFQSIALFVCSLFKPDARKLVTDLVCGLVYCRGGSCGDGGASPRRSSTRPSCVTDPYLRRPTEPDQELAFPVPEQIAIEGTGFLSHENSREDNNSDDDSRNNKDENRTADIDGEDVDPETQIGN